MHQTMRQIARETGIHHPSVYSIIHQDFQLISLKKRRAQELAIRQLCILVRLVARVTRYSRSTQIRCGGKYNIRYVLLQIFSRMILSKIMEIGSRIKKLLQK